MKLLRPWYSSFLIILAAILAAHFPLLFINQIENPDGVIIYDNLALLKFPFEYINALINFETVDFQPIRDITFYLDMWVFEHTGVVISVLINSIIWAGSCYLVLSILKKELKLSLSWQLLLLVLCFAVYPIFEPSINWGVARKHLLAFFFILCATRSLLEWEEEKKSILPVVSYYLLSLLSIPISIAWPAWVFLREGHFRGLLHPRVRSLIVSLFLISVLLAGINFAYYKTSYVFLEIYPPKISSFDFINVWANLGFQFKQIIFPYHISIFYMFDRSSFIYFGLLLVFITMMIYLFRSTQKAWMWPTFALPPLLVILSTPHIYFDTYVIVATFALFMFISTTASAYINRYGKLLILPFLVWFAITYKQNKFWSDPYLGYVQAMKITPNCTNAQTLAARYLKLGHKIPNNLFEYIQINSCLDIYPSMSPSIALKTITVEAIILMGEDEIDFEYREKRLRELGSKSIFVMVYYMAFLAKTSQPEKLERLLAQQNKILQGMNISFPYDPYYSDVVSNFCKKNELKECLKFMKSWTPKGKRDPHF